MPRRASILLALLPAACALHGAEEPTAHLHGAVALKLLVDDWDPVDRQVEGLVRIDWRRRDWPVAIAAGFAFARSTESGSALGVDDAEVAGETQELHLGVAWFRRLESELTLFAAGGVAGLRGEQRVEAPNVSAHESGVGIGGWLQGGVYWTWRETDIGLLAQWSFGRVDIGDDTFDAGGAHVGVLIGTGW